LRKERGRGRKRVKGELKTRFRGEHYEVGTRFALRKPGNFKNLFFGLDFVHPGLERGRGREVGREEGGEREE